MDIDCGDNSCRFATNRGGMRTNGGCRCFENAGFGPSAVGAALKMLPEIERLRAEQKGTVPLCRVCQQPQDYIHGDTCSRCAPSGPPQTVQKEG